MLRRTKAEVLTLAAPPPAAAAATTAAATGTTDRAATTTKQVVMREVQTMVFSDLVPKAPESVFGPPAGVNCVPM